MWQADLSEYHGHRASYKDEVAAYEKQQTADNTVRQWMEKMVVDSLKRDCFAKTETTAEWYRLLVLKARKDQMEIIVRG